jgi:hypothetical protein
MLAQLADTTAYEYWCDYATSGTGRYGRFRFNAATLGTGTAGYTVPADQYSESTLTEQPTGGPGQASYRQNLAVVDVASFYSLLNLPTPGVFPMAPYPARARTLSDSISFSASLQATSIQGLVDKGGTTITGGIAQHRYRYENSFRRKVSASLIGQDYFDPGDEYAFENLPGALPGETWIVSNVNVTVSNGEMITKVGCRTADWLSAVRRGS